MKDWIADILCVLASKGTDNPHPKYSWQDHELW